MPLEKIFDWHFYDLKVAFRLFYLVLLSRFIFIFSYREYRGPTSQGNDERRSRNYGSRGQYSPVIEIDEDSHSRFIGESSVGPGRSRYTGSNSGGAGLDDAEDVEWRLDQFCSPRNSLLSLVSDFVVKCTAKLTEINKKDRQEKSVELLDTKCYTKLADIAHSLLYTYDQECIKAKGLQKYMTKVFPITDWSQESMRPSLTIIIRRLDKLFAKMHKSVKSVSFIFQKASGQKKELNFAITVSSCRMERSRRLAKCRLFDSLETSLHRQRSKFEESYWHLPMPCGRRRLLDQLD